MNPYNENLLDVAASVLESQAVELTHAQSEYDASLFELYYAQGAEITTIQKLADSKIQLDNSNAPVKKNATNVNNLATNILASANQANLCGGQAVTNTAVTAANVQAAANATIKLASDVASIFSILTAANDGDKILKIAKTVHDLMNETAYHAELLSQQVMNATAQITEVPFAGVYDQAKSISSSTGNLLKIASADFDSAWQNLNKEVNNLAASAVAAKITEGTYLDKKTDIAAIKSGYMKANAALNLDLRVITDDTNGINFTVLFTPLHNPFKPAEINERPVQDYFIILVKKRKSSTFNITNAQQLLTDKARCCISVDSIASNKSITQQIAIENTWDTDDEPINRGQAYTAFVLGVFTNAYKTGTNIYDDFLSAPSLPFAMNIALKAPDSSHIRVESTNLASTENNAGQWPSHVVKFTMPAEETELNVRYQCILLPVKKARESKIKKNTPDFVFTSTLAQNTPFANYTIAKRVEDESNDNNTINYSAEITPATTDNFGSLLVNNRYYIPVILSVYSGPEEAKQGWYSPALSDLYATASFKYLIS
ncbi:hypothetical protein [Mucilaginibacter sp. FT3.2]|uniref:hypothetical protein n=1 Tax=Mucilaginibacter sp. FT3.2 TaxID=2723090 RepID=UPI00160B9F6F|nr:hypothetical protein [Mucilaginibacter sp. FT3.2]MBB6231260.1 hypothetical protein [Mucilaginibacter sp. FT3.2]